MSVIQLLPKRDFESFRNTLVYLSNGCQEPRCVTAKEIATVFCRGSGESVAQDSAHWLATRLHEANVQAYASAIGSCDVGWEPLGTTHDESLVLSSDIQFFTLMERIYANIKDSDMGVFFTSEDADDFLVRIMTALTFGMARGLCFDMELRKKILQDLLEV